MVNRPDSNSSSSTSSIKGLNPARNTSNNGVRSSFTRSNSDHDYKNRKAKTTNSLRNSSSFQNVNKAVNGNQSSRSSQILTPKVLRQRNNRYEIFD